MLDTGCLYLKDAPLNLLDLSKPSTINFNGFTKLWQLVEAQTSRLYEAGCSLLDRWALDTKADFNEEELLQLAKNHFTPR